MPCDIHNLNMFARPLIGQIDGELSDVPVEAIINKCPWLLNSRIIHIHELGS